MPTVVKILDYTGTTQQAVIPAGVISMDRYLWGGAGGGGGGDSAGVGRQGAAGHFVQKTSYSLVGLAGETLTVGVGDGGAGGTSGGDAAGGANGRGLTGYSGGVGGASGPTGSSGSGGGGGGATVVRISTLGDIAIAGGGGGGAGDGGDSVGTVGVNSNSATAAAIITLGENGAGHSGNGGGGGAGGGGANGGIGGNGGVNDTGGTGGFSGSNLVPGGGTGSNGTGITPTDTSPGYYNSFVAVGGNGGTTGGAGRAVFVFNVSVEGKVKINNAWKTINQIKFKHGGAWKDITAAYIKIAGVWKAIFNSGIKFVPTSAGFGDATGNPASGVAGSGPAAGGGGGGGGCSIICTKLHELGYLSDEIYRADERFGNWLRQTDPNAYYGYLKWARVVVDWMSNEGPQCMFWIRDKKLRNERQREMATRWARKIATPWAEHMAYKMGVLEQDNRAGRYIMNIGITVSRLIGRFVKHTNQPTKNVAIGYAMWAMFGLLYVIAGVR